MSWNTSNHEQGQATPVTRRVGPQTIKQGRTRGLSKDGSIVSTNAIKGNTLKYPMFTAVFSSVAMRTLIVTSGPRKVRLGVSSKVSSRHKLTQKSTFRRQQALGGSTGRNMNDVYLSSPFRCFTASRRTPPQFQESKPRADEKAKSPPLTRSLPKPQGNGPICLPQCVEQDSEFALQGKQGPQGSDPL